MKLNVLHITPHLGGGVGKALTTLVTHTPSVNHIFLLLESPEKKIALDQLNSLGADIKILSDLDFQAVQDMMSYADIVQVEWWNHPALPAFLCKYDLPEMRLGIWCHISGLHHPIIPSRLIDNAMAFVFTSPCSWANRSFGGNMSSSHLFTVSSGTGYPYHKERKKPQRYLRFGYVGSLNLSKMHPDFMAFIAAVKSSSFNVSIWGDLINQAILHDKAQGLACLDKVHFKGFTSQVNDVFSTLDVMTYLLNPLHYGTAENALLEAMSLGVVPIVLNNPAETAIVKDRENGLIVSDPSTFAEAVHTLENDAELLMSLSCQAQKTISAHFHGEKMGTDMQNVYAYLQGKDKKKICFKSILGSHPKDWFEIQQGNVAEHLYGDYVTKEQTKGSFMHYQSYFQELML